MGDCDLSQSALHGWHRTGGGKKTEERGESEAQDERETLIMSHMCTGKLSGNTGEQQTQ